MNKQEVLLVSLGLSIAVLFVWVCRLFSPEIPLYLPLTLLVIQITVMLIGSNMKK